MNWRDLRYQLLWRGIAAFEVIRGKGINYVTNAYGSFHVGDSHALLQFSSLLDPGVKLAVSECRGLFVDVGANLGLMSVIAAKHGCEVIAIEPAEATFELLKENFEANDIRERVTPMKIAAWAVEMPLNLEYNKQPALRTIGDSGEAVNGVPLDTILAGREPSLIKIDVEGHTREVLLGAMGTLARWRPKIVFEARPWMDELEEVAAILGRFGYVIKRLDKTNWLASAS